MNRTWIVVPFLLGMLALLEGRTAAQEDKSASDPRAADGGSKQSPADDSAGRSSPDQPPSDSGQAKTFNITGVVTSSDKVPLAQANVAIYETYTGAEKLYAKTRTDRDGKFAFQDIPQEGLWRYTLTASAPSFASRVVFVPHTPKGVVEFDLALAEPDTLRGRVVGPEGQPVSGAQVWTPSLKEPIPGVHNATTDINGYFQINDLTPWNSAEDDIAASAAPAEGVPADTSTNARLLLRIRHPDYGKKLVPYSQIPTSVFVQFERPMTITGRVVYRGQPAEGVQVTGGYVDALTDEEGRYRLTVQPLVDLTVKAGDGPAETRSQPLKGASAATVELPFLELAAPPDRRVEELLNPDLQWAPPGDATLQAPPFTPDTFADETARPAFRIIGTLVYDESRVANIHSSVSGRVERLYVGSPGVEVKKK